ncbi:hypothetical protein H072_6400 [Dactylellina haptotyla CBS 200.50]|uniref:Zn(2)-C6 fungal-type domain-containing protein n=1 Tax=Dactylellina haptotyla (strain CBS 200.50) TaxID=1284197 RepID=S8AFI4_DACHA|nr:hypothetical protein H072_6400 [Dactylellina haptotyla CBS 200.50]
MSTVVLPQALPLSMSVAVEGSLKPAHQVDEVPLDRAKKHTLDSKYTVAVQAVATDPAQPDQTHLLAAIGSFSKTEKETKVTGPDFMEVDKTPRQEDISRRSTWFCDSIFALDAHIKNQPINNTNTNPQNYLYNNNPQTDISGSFAAYRRLSLPPGFTLGRGAPFEFKTDIKTVMSEKAELDLPREIDGIEVNPEWGLTKAGKARQRLPIACTNCRGKKIKCLINKDGGPCHNCSKSDTLKISCRTEGRPRRQSSAIKRDKSKSRKRSSGRRPSQNEGDDSSTSFSRASSKDLGDDDMMLGGMDTSLLNLPLSTLAPGVPAVHAHSVYPGMGEVSYHPASDSPVSNVSDRSRQLSLESISSSYQPLFTSGYSLENEGIYDPRLFAAPADARTVSPLTKINPTSFPKQTRIQLPDELTTRNLVELFFTHLHWQGYGFLQPTSFLRNLTAQSPILLLCICAASCRLSDELRATNSPRILEAQAKQAALGERFVPTLTTIQAFLLLAFHYSATGDIEQANGYSDIAISMVKQIRLGDQVSDKLRQKERLGQSTIDPAIEIGKRTFWAAYIQDRSRHLTEQQTPDQRLAASDIPLPCREAEFDLRDSIEGSKGPFSATNNVGAMGYLVKIIDIRARLLHYLKISCTHLPQVYPPDNNSCDSRQLITELKIWEETLPVEYTFTADNFKGHFDGEHSIIETICLMHLIHHATVNQLHRYQDTKENFSEHYLPAFNHALSILAILRSISKYNDEVAKPVGKKIQLVSPFVPFAVGIACDTIGRLLTYLPEEYVLEDGRLLAHPSISLFFNARKYFRESLQSLRSYMHRTKAAADIYVMIRKLCVDIREACTDGMGSKPGPDPAGPHCISGVCINMAKLRTIAQTMIPFNSSVVDILYHGDYFASWYRQGGSQEIERLTLPATDRQRQSPSLPELSSSSLRMATTPLAHTTRPSEGYVTAVQLPQSTLAVFNLQVDASEGQGAAHWNLPPGSAAAASTQGSPLMGQDARSSHSGSVGLPEPFLHMNASLTPDQSATSSNNSIPSSGSSPLPITGAPFIPTATAEWQATEISGADMLSFDSLNFMDMDASSQEVSSSLDFSMEDLLNSNPFNNNNSQE